MTDRFQQQRLFVIGLDAYDPVLADRMIAKGDMPNLKRLIGNSVAATLLHGPEKFSGLAWEQFATGLSPEESNRQSAIEFDPSSYSVVQPTTRIKPFTTSLRRKTVVFDVPYFDLENDPASQGMVSWGSHDPGVTSFSRPGDLMAEAADRFGSYQAADYIYGYVWPDVAETERMGTLLARSVAQRADLAEWLFGTRLPDWDVAIMVISEFHSATEALWHGIDGDHPLHEHPSAAPARRGIEAVYKEADRLLGRLVDRFRDATFLLINPHGMGRNQADVMAMSVIPELMYRVHSGETAFTADQDWGSGGQRVGPEAAAGDWTGLIDKNTRFPIRHAPERSPPPAIDWMPAAWYRGAWPEMDAFALPAFYDARIRINLQGREAAGRIPRDRYEAARERITELFRECTDPITGAPLDIEIVLRPGDPLTISPSDADMTIRFNRDYYGVRHPTCGQIGPVPARRTGGHTGGPGVAYIHGWGEKKNIGSFPALEMTELVRFLAGDNNADCKVISALRARSSVSA